MGTLANGQAIHVRAGLRDGQPDAPGQARIPGPHPPPPGGDRHSDPAGAGWFLVIPLGEKEDPLTNYGAFPSPTTGPSNSGPPDTPIARTRRTYAWG